MISIIIPAYNEEKTIAETIRALCDFFNCQRPDYELVVVSDGSRDGTYDVAKKLENERVQVFSYPDNRGKGHALKYGFEKSRGDPVVFFDAGLDFPPEQILEFLGRLHPSDEVANFSSRSEEQGETSAGRTQSRENRPDKSGRVEELAGGKKCADLIIGSKRHSESTVIYPWHRKLVSLGAQTLVKMLLDLDVTDTQVGLKVFRREVLEKVMPLVLVKRYAFDIELLALAKEYGFKIEEAPVKLELKFSTAVSGQSLKRCFLDTLAVFYRLKVLGFYDLSEEARKELIAKYPVTAVDKITTFILGDLLKRKTL